MTLNKHSAFEGRVVFTTRSQSLKTNAQWLQFVDTAKSLNHELSQFLTHGVDDIGYMVSHTESIEFNFQGNETDALIELRDLWNKLAEKVDVESICAALDWRLNGHVEVVDAWKEAVNSRQQLWIDPTTAPLADLTPEQREEAETPGSPLTSPAGKSGKKS